MQVVGVEAGKTPGRAAIDWGLTGRRLDSDYRGFNYSP